MRSSAPIKRNVALCLCAGLFLLAAARAQVTIKPCVCVPCGGQIECPRGTTGWCECRTGSCHGGCLRNEHDPRRLAAAVLTVILSDAKKEVRPEALQQNGRQYADILRFLLSNQDDEQTYRIEYGARKIRFVLTPEMSMQLSVVVSELGGAAASDRPSPTPNPSLSVGHSGLERLTASKVLFSNGLAGLLVYGLLLLMWVYAVAVMVERELVFKSARSESREFAPLCAQALKQNRPDLALQISRRYRRSHIASVVNAGLSALMRGEDSPDVSGYDVDAVTSAMRRAVEVRAEEFKRGLAGLAAVGKAALLLGLFGFVVGLIYSLRGPWAAQTYLGVSAPPALFGGLFALGLGVLLYVFTRVVHSRLSSKVADFVVEMNNAVAELSEYLQENEVFNRQLST